MMSENDKPRPSVEIIAAVARDGGIGRNNALVWRDSDDLRHFKQLTLGSPIIMGRLTWESLGRPLPGRRNIVVTRQATWQAGGAERASSLNAALAQAADADRIFVIGGAQLYALALPRADILHLTEIDATFDADTFFPPWHPEEFQCEAGDPRTAVTGERYRFCTYLRKTATRPVPSPGSCG